MENEDKIKWFDRATKFQIEGMIFLVMKSRNNGVGAWAIEDSMTKKVLNSNMEWEQEVPLAQRDQSYLIRTRFDLESAMAMFEQYKMFSE